MSLGRRGQNHFHQSVAICTQGDGGGFSVYGDGHGAGEFIACLGCQADLQDVVLAGFKDLVASNSKVGGGVFVPSNTVAECSGRIAQVIAVITGAIQVIIAGLCSGSRCSHIQLELGQCHLGQGSKGIHQPGGLSVCLNVQGGSLAVNGGSGGILNENISIRGDRNIHNDGILITSLEGISLLHHFARHRTGNKFQPGHAIGPVVIVLTYNRIVAACGGDVVIGGLAGCGGNAIDRNTGDSLLSQGREGINQSCGIVICVDSGSLAIDGDNGRVLHKAVIVIGGNHIDVNGVSVAALKCLGFLHESAGQGTGNKFHPGNTITPVVVGFSLYLEIRTGSVEGIAGGFADLRLSDTGDGNGADHVLAGIQARKRHDNIAVTLDHFGSFAVDGSSNIGAEGIATLGEQGISHRVISVSLEGIADAQIHAGSSISPNTAVGLINRLGVNVFALVAIGVDFGEGGSHSRNGRNHG